MVRARRNPLLILGLSALLAAAGCGLGTKAAPTIGGPSALALQAAAKGRFVTAQGISLFVEPEAGLEPVTSAIDGAKTQIDLQMYLLSNDAIVEALIRAAGRGVKVRVMLEPNPFNPQNPAEPLPINQKTALKLRGTGVLLAWSDPAFRFTHSKLMIIDRAAAYIMTLNFSKSGTTKNREFAAIDTDPADVRDLNRLFDADWGHLAYVPRARRLVVSPANAKEKLTNLIAGARKSLTIYDEILYDTNTQDLLGAKAKEGVAVKVLMGDPATVPDNAIAAERMKRMGVAVRYVDLPVVHAKMIVADDARAYIGSVNLTTNSLLKNREVGILLDDPAHLGVLNGTFGGDWAKSQEFKPPVLVNGVLPVLAPPPAEGDRG